MYVEETSFVKHLPTALLTAKTKAKTIMSIIANSTQLVILDRVVGRGGKAMCRGLKGEIL